MRAVLLITLILVGTTAAAAERFVTTKGEGKAEVRPDFITIDMTLLAIGADLNQLKSDVDDRTRRVLAAATQMQVAGQDVESGGLNVTREYETDRNDNDNLRGYRVSRSIQVKLRTIDKYEQFAQALIEAKVDEIDGVDVDVDDRPALNQRALTEATRNARNKAQAIAAELGIKLGTPIEVSEDRLWLKNPLNQRARDGYGEIVVTANKLQGTPVTVLVFQPHSITVEATVWTRFEILDKE